MYSVRPVSVGDRVRDAGCRQHTKAIVALRIGKDHARLKSRCGNFRTTNENAHNYDTLEHSDHIVREVTL
jgi:hypothetical protein